MELIKYPSPNYGLRRDDTEIDFIILHYTAMGIENSLDRLCDPTHEVSKIFKEIAEKVKQAFQ